MVETNGIASPGRITTMKTLIQTLDLRSLVGRDTARPTVILIASALMPALHRYFGSLEAARRFFPGCDGLTASFFMFSTAFVLFGVIPLLVVIRIFDEDPRDFGLQIGDWRTGLRLNGILIPLIAVALLYPASLNAEIRSMYPFAPEAGRSAGGFFMLQAPRGVLFYTAWEFFYRGFMLFGLRRYVGDWLAICIQTIPQCLWHIGMPTGEILLSIAGGILFGIMALRTRSILWPMLLHFSIGVFLDLFIVLRT
jgi:membrane protease YdiL (CAAX protease family)